MRIGNSDELKIEAAVARLPEVEDFVESHLSRLNCSLKTMMQINVAVEEIFVNIASYAYKSGHGDATVCVSTQDDPRAVSISFTDSGVPYDPLAKVDPDVTLSADKRQIGGLGIFMTKKLMDHVSYEYKGGKNILTMTKLL